MGFGSELKKSSKLENSKIVKERTVLPGENEMLKHQDKIKRKNRVNTGDSDQPSKLKQNADNRRILDKTKLSRNERPYCVREGGTNDELVKYMSKLPGYLQHMETGGNVQEKALNVGVLDWGRLEKWKPNQKHNPATERSVGSSISNDLVSKNTIRSSAFPAAVESETLAHQSKQRHLPRSSNYPPQKDDLSRYFIPSTQKSKHCQDFGTAFQGTLDGQEKILGSYKSRDVGLEKGKRENRNRKAVSRKGSSTSNSGDNGFLIRPSMVEVGACDGESRKSARGMAEIDITEKVADHIITSNRGSSLRKLRHGFSHHSRETLNTENDIDGKIAVDLPESGTDLAHQPLPGENGNIVLLLPKKCSQNSIPEEYRASFNRNLTGNRNSLSGDLSPKEVHAVELSSEIPYSCPLPSRAEDDPSQTPPCSLKVSNRPSKGKSAEQESSKLANGNTVESLDTDQEMAEVAHGKGRTPSPNRRFNFSLGRMARSFSFKEGSSVLHLNSPYVSVKSGPVTSGGSACLDNSKTGIIPRHSRTKSSPLRRILDPLLKPRGLKAIHSTEPDEPFRESVDSVSSCSLSANYSVHSENDKASTTQAFVQLSTKNGLPMFRFVANNSNILAIALRNSAPSEKDGAGLNFTFYSVSEIKKKGGRWMSQGGKGRTPGYAYNVVGQMKDHSSSMNLNGQSSGRQYMAREFILFGVELKQTDQTSPTFAANRELAAVVVKMPIERLDLNPEEGNREKFLVEKGCSEDLPENGCLCYQDENNVTVILPSGVHGLPDKGFPSPLINRWRSGGLCDCGGWDIGCRLHILSNQKHCNALVTSEACSVSNRFQLFIEGGSQQNSPVFSLTTVDKGIYSVEFSSLISLLQACFFSASIICCQKSFDQQEGRYEKIYHKNQNGRVQQKHATLIFAEV
ncbi:uncharacterized protein LOC119990991 isoform X2 [Tripterygium wilfordii]|uniref:uncharacterized protein LOC119990991 isoform X2 n=1 Tax=Tripterygium wilfordii TaxID=458696 RepID=UPI0018F859F3|nr:uncharacterized protein LOC119990991 isoform X2 [Tripterygium wilfordii]